MAVGRGSGGSSSRSLAISDVLLPALELKILLIVVVNVKTKGGRVDVAVTPDEQSTKDRLSEDVKDAIEDRLRVRRDVVTTFAHAPGNRVKLNLILAMFQMVNNEIMFRLTVHKTAVSEPHCKKVLPISLPMALACLRASQART